MAFSAGLGALPASAVEPPRVSPEVERTEVPESPAADGSGTAASPSGILRREPGPAEAGLHEAALRDLGLTAEEFAAAGQLGRQAGEVAAALRDIPGYLGIRLHDGRIMVAGSGPELDNEVARLGAAFPALALENPPGAPSSGALAAATTSTPPTPTADAPSAAAGAELARSTGQLYQAYIREVGPEGLQAVAYTGSTFVIRTGGANAAESARPEGGAGQGTAGGTAADQAASSRHRKLTAAEFVARFANVELDAGTGLVPEEDLLGGQGYIADTWEICSTGFAAFDPAGLPALLTAGHCARDGAARQADLENPPLTRGGLLGSFGFSQFGGPGNSPVLDPANPENPGNVGTDIAVIGSVRAGLDPVPAAATWHKPAVAGPDVKVIGRASPVVGQPVCRSGRTSAWSCGTIDEVGIYVVQGTTAAPTDLRAFNGFLSFAVQSSGGDSGGPWLSGNYAVGTHSAGEGVGEPVNFAVAATLDDAMAVLPGYELELFLNRPEVTSPAPGAAYGAGQTVTGVVAAAPASAVAAGSKVRITVAGQAPFEVPVDAAGAWSFAPTAASGPLRFTAETVNGFSTSGAAAFSFAPVPPPSQSREDQSQEDQPRQPYPAPAGGPSVSGALAPAGGSAVVVRPFADRTPAGKPPADLADTGASGLVPAAGIAAGALAAGAVLLAVARRRTRPPR